MEYRYTYTVFTATYNRAHTLHRVYESLAAQTFRDFEWVVVDDGSQDGTRARVASWAREATFPIRYFWQPNSGKHVAFNRGVREARGELFLNFDSDDACVPEALERMRLHWLAIPAAERASFSAVTVNCMDEQGRVVGNALDRPVLDSDTLEAVYRFGVRGEKWGFHRTDVLRAFPFPEPRGVPFVPEMIVWGRIARQYRTRFVNEPLRLYFRDQPSLASRVPPGGHARSRLLGHAVVLNEHADYLRFAPKAFARSAIQYARCSLHAGVPVRRQGAELQSRLGRTLWCLALPAAGVLYTWDCVRLAARAVWDAGSTSIKPPRS